MVKSTFSTSLNFFRGLLFMANISKLERIWSMAQKLVTTLKDDAIYFSRLKKKKKKKV
jgi:hypothetical protein